MEPSNYLSQTHKLKTTNSNIAIFGTPGSVRPIYKKWPYVPIYGYFYAFQSLYTYLFFQNKCKGPFWCTPSEFL